MFILRIKMYLSSVFLGWSLYLCPFPAFQKELEEAILSVTTKYEERD